MGLFDFFKKKKAEPAEPFSLKNAIKPLNLQPTSSSNSTSTKQPTTTVPTLNKFERYGKASLIGYKSDDWEAAMKEFQILENEGFGEASIALGQYAQITDHVKALQHFRKAAAAGIAEGAWGCAALLGHDYVADITGKDKEWYTCCLQAAKGGCSDAMNELGNMYNRKNDFLAAFYWYQMAAYYEHPHGYYAVEGVLGKYNSEGKPELSTTIDGVRPKDVKNATAIFRCMTKQDVLDNKKMDEFMNLAVEDDNEIMGLFIGHFFEDVVQMPGNAKMGYQLAAQNESIMGMKCLADMQAAGKGCERNMKAAAEWYQGAAEKCEKTACFVMGEFLKSKNRNLAAYYYSVAYRRGYDPAIDRLEQL